jgi:uncharacterized membrane protein
MNIKTLAIAAAVGSFLVAGTMSSASAADAPSKDKCYGVAKAGKNDCAASGHSCAGQAKTDNDPNDWKHMSNADCEKAGGKTMPPAKM